MDDFRKELKNVDIIFSGLFTVDMIGQQIVNVAKNDNDFEKWLKDNNINLSDQSDWINQYAQRIK
jgi:hypothetical protein